MFDRKKRKNTSSAVERKQGGLRSKFGGVKEELILISGLAVHFRFLARVLDAYGRSKHCPKTDHLVWQLQLSDTGEISQKRNIAPSWFSVCNN